MSASIPLIGRSAEIETIERQISAAHQGPGRQVAIVTQSGAGKSALLNEIAEQATQHGHLVAKLPCRGGSLAERDALRLFFYQLLDIDPVLDIDAQQDALYDLLAEHQLLELEAFLVDTLGLALDGPRPQAGFVDVSTALTRLVRALAQSDTRLVLVIDDVDEASPNIRGVLERLCSVSEATNAFMLMSATRNLPVALASHTNTILQLRTLIPREIVQLAQHIFERDDIPQSVLSQLVSLSHGLPLPTILIAEALKHFTPQQEMQLPTMIQAVNILVEQLDDHQREVLQAASVVGKAIPEYILQALGILDATPLLGALEAGRWLTRESTSSIYRFTNNVVYQVIYDYVPGNVRATLHEQVGNVFFNPDSGSLARRKVDLAVYHYVRSGKREQALDALGLAIEEAALQHNLEARRDLLKNAVELSATSATLRSQHLQFAEQLGDLYTAQDDYQQAALAYSEPGISGMPMHISCKLGLVLTSVEPSRAVTILKRAVKQIPTRFPEDLKWRGVAGLVWALLLTNQPYEALREGRNALATLNQLSGYGEAITLLRATLGMVHQFNGELVEAGLHYESAKGAWLARDNDTGLALLSRLQAKAPRDEITRLWLRLVLHPVLGKPML